MKQKGNMENVPGLKIPVSEKFLFLAKMYGQYVTMTGFILLPKRNK